MAELAGFVTFGAPALAGIGAGLVTYASVRRRGRINRSRRLAHVVGLEARTTPGSRPARAAWSHIHHSRRWLGQTLIAHQTAAARVATGVALSGVLMSLIGGELAWGVPVAAAVGVMIWLRRQSAAYRRLEQQAPAALEMLSAGLRAGYSVPQAIAMVARESPEPTATEFGSVGRELDVGSTLTDSLTHLAERTALADYMMVSTVIWIHAQVGGNLAVVLDSVVVTLRERFDLREQVHALTAQQRMASTTLAMLPVGVLLLLLLVDRPFVEPMFAEPAGRVLLGIGSVLLGLGWTTMRLLCRVEL